MDDQAVEMVDLDEIGLGRGHLKLGPDGKPISSNIYGASNADKNFIKKFTTQTEIAKAEQAAEAEMLYKQQKEGKNAGRWFGKMNFSLTHMAEMQRQRNTILSLNPEL